LRTCALDSITPVYPLSSSRPQRAHLGQFLGDVVVHLEVLRPGLRGSIHVETGAWCAAAWLSQRTGVRKQYSKYNLAGVHTSAEVPAIVVEASTLGEVVVWEPFAPAWRGVGSNDGHAVLGGCTMRAALLHDVLVGACKPRQVVKCGHLRCLGLRREKHGEDHVGLGGCARMGHPVQHATEALDSGQRLERHLARGARRGRGLARGRCT
jgi:hypothetical protein